MSTENGNKEMCQLCLKCRNDSRRSQMQPILALALKLRLIIAGDASYTYRSGDNIERPFSHADVFAPSLIHCHAGAIKEAKKVRRVDLQRPLPKS